MNVRDPVKNFEVIKRLITWAHTVSRSEKGKIKILSFNLRSKIRDIHNDA